VLAALETLTGLRLTQGAITQDALRRASGQLGTTRQQLCRSIRESPMVYTDDTGWRVRGQNAHLMASDTDEATVYQSSPGTGTREVQEVVPASYQGVMVTDQGRSYKAHSFSRFKQQKCLSHLQKTLSLLLEKKKGRVREPGENLKMLCQMAMELWEEYHQGARGLYYRVGGRIWVYLLPAVVSTWAPIGKTPILQHKLSRGYFSAISDITLDGGFIS
jgi:transposase